MKIDKLSIETKVDNQERKRLNSMLGIPTNETISADETNKIVLKTNEVVDELNSVSKTVSEIIPITAFNFKTNVPTYSDLPNVGNEVNDGYGVLSDGLIYVFNGVSFPTEGNGMDLGLKPTGVVSENEALAVSGSKVFEKLRPIGIATHRNNYGEGSIVTEFLSHVEEIYILDNEPSANAEDYKMNYIWTNSDNIHQPARKWGFQLAINEGLNSNYGIPFDATENDIVNGKLVELNITYALEPLYGRVRVFAKFKSLPNGVIFTTPEIYPFNNSAFISKTFDSLIDFYRPTDYVEPTVNKLNITASQVIWFSLIKNIYVIDENNTEGDTYQVSYVWLNHGLGVLGFQLNKNDGDPTNYRIIGDVLPNTLTALSGVGEALDATVKVIIETADFGMFPDDSFLQFIQAEQMDKILLPAAFQYQKTKKVLDFTQEEKGGNVVNVVRLNLEEHGNNAIQNAITSITDNTKENRYDLRVSPGTYKVSNSSQYLGYPGYPAMILAKDHVDITGDSKDDCILWAELPYIDAEIDTAIERGRHQTIYNWADDCVISNFTIVAKNIRYVVHQDNPNEAYKTRYYKNCDFLFLGNKGNQVAFGIGTFPGSKTYIEGGRSYSANSHSFGCHNNQNFDEPSLWNFKGHTFSTLQQVCAAIQNSGSNIADVIHLENCKFEGGFILSYLEWWIYTPNHNDCFNHANWKITGFGNEPAWFFNDVKGSALKVQASNVGDVVRFDKNSTAYPLIIANTRKYFGNLGHPERKVIDEYVIHDYVTLLHSYAIGGKSIKEDNYIFGQSASEDKLGLRLGDCSTVNKTLTIHIGASSYNVVFNKNYTAFTNAQVIAEINTVLGSVGTASEYNIGLDYYPEFTDANYKMLNDSSEAILKGTLVTKRGSGIAKATTGDIVHGIAIDDIEPGWRNGEGVYYGFGRIIKKMIFHTDQVLKEPGITIEKNKKYSALNGKLVEDINGNLIGFDNNYLLIN